jgi:hypothetical protein
MPPLPSVPNVVRVDWLWSDSADTNVSTKQYFKYSGSPPTSADCVALAAEIYSLQSAMHAQWDGLTVLEGTRVTDLSSPSGGLGEHAESTTGTRPGNSLAGGIAVLVNYVISRRYRGGKPRNYFPFFVASDLTTRQSWFGTSLTELDSALSTYFGGVAGLSSGGTTLGDHVNISYYDGFRVVTSPTTGRARNVPTLRTTPLVDTILSYAASSRPSSQRRRN